MRPMNFFSMMTCGVTMRKNRTKKSTPNWRARVTIHTMFAEVEVPTSGGIKTKQVALESVAGVFNDVPVGTGLLPKNVLFIEHAQGGARIGVYVPAGTHTLRTLQQTYNLPMPALVLVGQGMAYQLYALKGDQWPNRQTEMYYPPMPNIFPGNVICAGEMTLPTCEPRNIWSVWEMVAGSYFTGHLTSERCKTHQSIFDLWHEMHLSNAETFPEDELVSTNKTMWNVMRGDK